MRLLEKYIAEESIPREAGEPAVEVLGWLELHLDDAPALVITGCNEGFLPTAVSSDPFLPEGLRRRLGLPDNARRYARDAYAPTCLSVYS